MFGVFIAVAFGLAAALSWGVSDYLGGYSSKKIGYYNTTAYVGLFSAIVTATPPSKKSFAGAHV